MRRRVLGALIASMALLVGCTSQDGFALQSPAYGPIGTEAEAIAAARILTTLAPPLQVVGPVRHGIGRDLYTGALSQEIFERLQRTAWRVNLTGLAPPNGCGTCTPVLWTQELIIDQQTGSLLVSVSSESPSSQART